MKLLIAAALVLAQNTASDDYNEGYRKGFADGFAQGSRQQQTVAPAAVAPPPPKPGPTGPITISNAWYGTDKKNCNATRWLAPKVNGRISATVDVSNSICGDPAPGARKSLEVTYICGSFVKTASAFEHRSISLDCGS
jgi:hypothetical protein